MPAGLSEAGGIARAGQAFAVNGQRPESNNYLLDGVSNVDSVNGGYALRVPGGCGRRIPHSYAERAGRIWRHQRSDNSVVTKSGGNRFHGDVYDFLRNDAIDAPKLFRCHNRTSSSQSVRRVRWAAPSAKTKISSLLYYEGQRDPKVRHRPRSFQPPPSAPAISQR